VAVTRPGRTPCVRCYLEELPPPGSGPTCDTAGVVPTLPPLVASLGMTEVLRLAAGGTPSSGLLSLTGWDGGVRSRRLLAGAAPSSACPACAGRRFPALEDEASGETIKLCGRQSVQIRPRGRERPDFEALERRLAPVGRVRRSPQLLNADVDGISLTVFADG